MPQNKRRATFFLWLMVVALVLLTVAFILLVTQRPTLPEADKPVRWEPSSPRVPLH